MMARDAAMERLSDIEQGSSLGILGRQRPRRYHNTHGSKHAGCGAYGHVSRDAYHVMLDTSAMAD